jgi:hypothetical protein
MYQRLIIIYLDLKKLSGRTIHENLVATLGHDAVVYSIITCYLRETRCFPSADRIASDSILEMPDDPDEAILSALGEMPFASVR